MFLKKRKAQKEKINVYNQLLQVHKNISEWYFGYYFGILIPDQYMCLLNNLCKEEYLLAVKIYGEKAIKLTFDNIEYLRNDNKILWWDMWGLSIYRA